MLGIPKHIESIIYFNMAFLFIISFYHMQYDTNLSSIKCLNTFYNPNLSSGDSILYLPENNFNFSIGNISYYNNVDFQINQIKDKNKYIIVADFIIFFIWIPLMNIVWGIWCLKNGLLWLPKSLYSRIYFNNRGVN